MHGPESCDVLGFSLGGAIAQVIAQDRPSLIHKMILVGTAPRGGEDVMHLEKPALAKHLADSTLHGHWVLQKLFFTPSEASQAAGEAFVGRIMQRQDDLDPSSKPEVAQAQIAAFREWDRYTGDRFADLKGIRQATLVVNGTFDTMIAVRNSYWLAEHLPNAVLLTYPDAGHGSLFQYPESFTRHANAFLALESDLAPY
jgi:pimeloyl-ACP methyl ester carboxylesterase